MRKIVFVVCSVVALVGCAADPVQRGAEGMTGGSMVGCGVGAIIGGVATLGLGAPLGCALGSAAGAGAGGMAGVATAPPPPY